MKVKDITSELERWAPLSLQEDYDNSGLLIGDGEAEVDHILITLDVTEEVINEAISLKCQLIIAHHPLIFTGLKKINNDHWVDRCVRLAIKHDISVYAIHTNLDIVRTGVNARFGELLGLRNIEILENKQNTLLKLTTFIPTSHTEIVLEKLFEAGAGNIGEYDRCSFRQEGIGTFRPSENATPTIGVSGEIEYIKEDRVEVLIPAHLQSKILNVLIQHHPYEEVAYYLQSLRNKNQEIGSGMIGELEYSIKAMDLIPFIKKQMNVQMIRHTRLHTKTYQKIAICGGSGRFLLERAIAAGADAFISADFKYHDFFEADNRITILDIGHYESEVSTKGLLNDFLKQKFANIAFRLSGVVTNPIIYS